MRWHFVSRPAGPLLCRRAGAEDDTLPLPAPALGPGGMGCSLGLLAWKLGRDLWMYVVAHSCGVGQHAQRAYFITCLVLASHPRTLAHDPRRSCHCQYRRLVASTLNMPDGASQRVRQVYDDKRDMHRCLVWRAVCMRECARIIGRLDLGECRCNTWRDKNSA